MRKKDVKVGGVYYAEVSRRTARVQIVRVSPYGGWDARNLDTGRMVYFHTGRRIHRPVEGRCQMLKYVVERGSGGVGAYVEDGARRLPLDPRLDLADHSPTGYGYGYGGSGPAQLALAILADALRRAYGSRRRRAADKAALDLYLWFKWDVIAVQTALRWEITHEDVMQWVISHSCD